MFENNIEKEKIISTDKVAQSLQEHEGITVLGVRA
jgi:hypothetical protein